MLGTRLSYFLLRTCLSSSQLLLACLYEDVEVEEAGAAEVERRISDVENGVTQLIPIAYALAQVRAALK